MNERASDAVTIKNTELATVREAMRELSHLLERLDAGEIEKIVLTQKNQMRGVLLTVERYAELDARPIR
jgi:antitoxin (DNA-binding transcriptional repressor) of toxin-antitoxin stability system